MSAEDHLQRIFKSSLNLYKMTGDRNFIDSWAEKEVLWLMMCELEGRINREIKVRQ